MRSVSTSQGPAVNARKLEQDLQYDLPMAARKEVEPIKARADQDRVTALEDEMERVREYTEQLRHDNDRFQKDNEEVTRELEASKVELERLHMVDRFLQVRYIEAVTMFLDIQERGERVTRNSLIGWLGLDPFNLPESD